MDFLVSASMIAAGIALAASLVHFGSHVDGDLRPDSDAPWRIALLRGLSL
jgi:hypothetical protein